MKRDSGSATARGERLHSISASTPVLSRIARKSSSVFQKPFCQKKPWQPSCNPTPSQLFRGAGQPPIRIAAGERTRKFELTQANHNCTTRCPSFSRQVAGSTAQGVVPSHRSLARNEQHRERRCDGGVKKLTEMWEQLSRGENTGAVASPRRPVRSPLLAKVSEINGALQKNPRTPDLANVAQLIASGEPGTPCSQDDAPAPCELVTQTNPALASVGALSTPYSQTKVPVVIPRIRGFNAAIATTSPHTTESSSCTATPSPNAAVSSITETVSPEELGLQGRQDDMEAGLLGELRLQGDSDGILSLASAPFHPVQLEVEDMVNAPEMQSKSRAQTPTGDGKVQGQLKVPGCQEGATYEEYKIGNDTPGRSSICSEYSRAFDLVALQELRDHLSPHVVSRHPQPATLSQNLNQESLPIHEAPIVAMTPTSLIRRLHGHRSPLTVEVPRDLHTLDLRYYALLYTRMHRKSSSDLEIEQAAAETRQRKRLSEVLDRGSSNALLPAMMPTRKAIVGPVSRRRFSMAAEARASENLEPCRLKKFVTGGKNPDPYYIVAREFPGSFSNSCEYVKPYTPSVHHVLRENVTQYQVFDEIAKFQIDDFLQCQNVAFITLGGVTGMGKSYSFFGESGTISCFTTGIAFSTLDYIFTDDRQLNPSYEFRLSGCGHYSHRLYPLLPVSNEPSPVFTDAPTGHQFLKEMLARRRGGGSVDMAMICITMHDQSSGIELSRCTFVDTTSSSNTAKSNLVDCIKRNSQSDRPGSKQFLLEHGFFRKIKATVSGNDPGSTTLILCASKSKMKETVVAYLGARMTQAARR